MAIPNLAPGHFTQGMLAAKRREENEARRKFEDEQRRKALGEGIGRDVLRAALNFGTQAGAGALRDKATAERQDTRLAAEKARQGERLKSQSDLQSERLDQAKGLEDERRALSEHRLQMNKAWQTGTTEIKPAHDPEVARRAIMGARAEQNTAVLRPGREEGRVYGRSAPEAPSELMQPKGYQAPRPRAERETAGPAVPQRESADPRRGVEDVLGPARSFGSDRDERVWLAAQAGRRKSEQDQRNVDRLREMQELGHRLRHDAARMRSRRRGSKGPRKTGGDSWLTNRTATTGRTVGGSTEIFNFGNRGHIRKFRGLSGVLVPDGKGAEAREAADELLALSRVSSPTREQKDRAGELQVKLQRLTEEGAVEKGYREEQVKKAKKPGSVDAAEKQRAAQQSESDRRAAVRQSSHFKAIGAARDAAAERARKTAAPVGGLRPNDLLSSPEEIIQAKLKPESGADARKNKRWNANMSKKVRAAFSKYKSERSKLEGQAVRRYLKDNSATIGTDVPGGVEALRSAVYGTDAPAPKAEPKAGMWGLPAPGAAQPQTPRATPRRAPATEGRGDQSAVDIEAQMDRAFREINAMDLPASVKRRMFNEYTNSLGVA